MAYSMGSIPKSNVENDKESPYRPVLLARHKKETKGIKCRFFAAMRMSVELDSGTSHTSSKEKSYHMRKPKIPESMIQKKRELHLSYSQAFGVALPTDKFSPRYSAGIHFSIVGIRL